MTRGGCWEEEGQTENQTTPQTGAQWYLGDLLSPVSPLHPDDALCRGASRRAQDLDCGLGSFSLSVHCGTLLGPLEKPAGDGKVPSCASLRN